MLKRIHIQHLTLGMYLHEFCGSWMDHPFWRAKFLLKDPKDLARIQATAIQEIWIDTDKGLDVAEGTASMSREEVDAQIETDFSRLEDLPPIKVTLPSPPRPPQARPQAFRHAQQAQHGRRHLREVQRSRGVHVQRGPHGPGGGLCGRPKPGGGDFGLRHPQPRRAHQPGAAEDRRRLHLHALGGRVRAHGGAGQAAQAQGRPAAAGRHGGLLHDLGKAAIPLAVLNKPGKLTDQEFTVVRSHPVEGYHMLKEGGNVPDAVLDACLHHHEKVDGSGYPDKLAGEGISVIARMTAICDVYDAITSDRPYKRGWDPAESLRRMAEWTKDHFDARIFQAFVKSIGIYPVGSLVRLTSGRIGIVTDQSPTALTTPIVKVLFSTKSDLRIPPEVVNLAAPDCNEKIVAREDPEKWRFPDLDELWSGFSDKVW